LTPFNCQSVKNILIISTTGMGDCLWGTPGVRALKKSFPNAGIDLLIRPEWEGIYFDNPHIRTVISYSPQWYHQLALLPRLMGMRYDQVLIFHANKDIRRLLPRLRYARILAHQNLPGLLDEQILKFSQTTHPILRRMALLEKTGVESDGVQMDIFLNDKDNAEVISFLEQNQMKSKEFVYLNVGASLPHKRWPSDRMTSLAKLILENTSLGIIFGGGPEDAQTIEEIENQINKERVTHAHHRSLRANCALIDQARLMITTDTGPMHIAFATKVPTIALFGPTHPSNSGPCQIDPQLCQVLQSTAMDTLDHAPTDQSNFFDSITVEMVWEKVNQLLA